MTKTIVLGTSNQDDNKPIEFKYLLDEVSEVTPTQSDAPYHFNYIELICKKYDDEGQDLMFAYNDATHRSSGTLYIGYWNSGTVK